MELQGRCVLHVQGRKIPSGHAAWCILVATTRYRSGNKPAIHSKPFLCGFMIHLWNLLQFLLLTALLFDWFDLFDFENSILLSFTIIKRMDQKEKKLWRMFWKILKDRVCQWRLTRVWRTLIRLFGILPGFRLCNGHAALPSEIRCYKLQLGNVSHEFD